MLNPELQTLSLDGKRRLWVTLTAVILFGFVLFLFVTTLPTLPAPAPQLDQVELPLAFVPNAGQTADVVRFQAHDAGSTLFFTPQEVVLTLPAGDTAEPAVLRLQFEGVNAATAVRGVAQLPGRVNYIRGNDPAAWQTDLPTYSGIVYEQLYPGIDLRYDGANGRLKGTYVVAPGADPAQIRWSHVGAASISVDEASGDLFIALPGGQTVVTEGAPVAWQTIDGRQVAVEARYVLENGRVGFALGSYDATRPLTIDPTLVYSTYLGGSNFEDAEGIAVDAAGFAYVTGTTSSNNFPTKNPYQGSKRGDEDIFISKINVAGNALVYSTYVGGGEDDEGNDIAVDANGNVYVVGTSDSANFPTRNAYQGNLRGFEDAVVVKLNAAGSALLYGTYLGGSNVEEGEGIAVDNNGRAVVTGSTASANFPTKNAYQGSIGGGFFDAFVTKLAAGGDALVYSTYLGGNRMDAGADVALSSNGQATVVGDTWSGDFPTKNAVQNDLDGSNDVFVTRLVAGGDALVYSTYLGGSGKDYAYGVAVNGAGEAFVTGNTESSNFPTKNALQDTKAGRSDAFVASLNGSGGSLVYSTYLGGSKDDKGHGIAVGGSDRVYVTGDTFSSDFPTENALQGSSGGEADAFVAQLNGNGRFVYSTYLGGSKSDHGDAIAVDDQGNAYVAGVTGSQNFPTVNPLQGSLKGTVDVFVAKISGAGGGQPPTPTPTPDPGQPTPTPTPTTEPPPTAPDLRGSIKYASQVKLGPDEELTYTIRLHNSGTEDAVADVSDAIPEELIYVDGSVTGGGVYDADTATITWENVTVSRDEDVLLEFVVKGSQVEEAQVVKNTAVITPEGEDSFERSFPVLLLPDPVDGDTEPPVVESVVIDEQDVLEDTDVTLYITASDNVEVKKMYIREWYLETRPFAHWEATQSSGWIPYEAEYDWTLLSESGAHFIGVWVADAARNVSHLDRQAMDYASLLLPDTTVRRFDVVPYLVHYQADEDVTATLTTSSGDADLLVWYPDSYWWPDEYSVEPGTETDEVNFVTPTDGTYLFVVRGHKASTFDLSITPAGGPEPPWATMMEGQEGTAVRPLPAASEDDADLIFSILLESGLDPLGVAEAPDPPPPTTEEPAFKIFVPTIFVKR